MPTGCFFGEQRNRTSLPLVVGGPSPEKAKKHGVQKKDCNTTVRGNFPARPQRSGVSHYHSGIFTYIRADSYTCGVGQGGWAGTGGGDRGGNEKLFQKNDTTPRNTVSRICRLFLLLGTLAVSPVLVW